MMQAALESGFEPQDVPDLLITADDPTQRDDDTLEIVH